MPLPLGDHCLAGDGETAAPVGRDGSPDWLCLTRFDGAACFAALLGTPEHGRWRLAPGCPVLRATRRCRPGTLVLDTEFETARGVVAVVGCVPPRNGAADVAFPRIGGHGSRPCAAAAIRSMSIGER